MFGSIGMTELIVIMVVALVVIGPKRLPELARTLGKALGDFKRATSDFQSSFSMEDDYDLDVLDEEVKEKDKKAGSEDSDEDDADEAGHDENDDAAEQTAEPKQTEADEPAPEPGDVKPEAETAATESEAAEDKTGAAREDDKQT